MNMSNFLTSKYFDNNLFLSFEEKLNFLLIDNKFINKINLINYKIIFSYDYREKISNDFYNAEHFIYNFYNFLDDYSILNLFLDFDIFYKNKNICKHINFDYTIYKDKYLKINNFYDITFEKKVFFSLFFVGFDENKLIFYSSKLKKFISFFRKTNFFIKLSSNLSLI